MVQSYKQKPVLKDQYDTIIIGSGMGSLSTAAILAKRGKKVLILERHYEPGGFTHTFKRKDYEWDVGVHYIGQMQYENSILTKLFKYITNGQLKWADMGEVYDKIIIGEKSYDFVKGVQNFKDKMSEYFPDDQAAIEEYVRLVFKANSKSKMYFLDKALPSWMSASIGYFMRRPYYKYSDRTTYEVLSEITNNQELIKVLLGQYGDYGLTPKKSSFTMHAALAAHYFGGGNYPIGGSSQILKTIDPVIEEAGGTILISAEVEEILIKGNRAIGVKMKDGKSFKAPNIVSGVGIMNTYAKLLAPEIQKRHGLDKLLTKISPSIAHGCLYVGLKGSPQELKLPKSNYWVYPEDLDHDACVDRYVADIEQPFPIIYYSFPAAKDPDWSNRYPDRSTIDIITLIPYETFEKWEDKKWKKRGEDYDQLKEKIAQRLLADLYKQLPHLKGRVDYYELSTPLSTRHFVNYDKGEVYGLDHTPNRFRQRFLKPATPIKNLYLTGQDIISVGVGSALFSGVLTAAALTKRNVLVKILQASGKKPNRED